MSERVNDSLLVKDLMVNFERPLIILVLYLCSTANFYIGPTYNKGTQIWMATPLHWSALSDTNQNAMPVYNDMPEDHILLSISL